MSKQTIIEVPKVVHITVATSTGPLTKCVVCSGNHELKDCKVKLCQWCQTPTSKSHIDDRCYLAKCLRCHRHGHAKAACNTPLVCNFCKEKGHSATPEECPAIKKLVCKKCNAKGDHTTARCKVLYCAFCTKQSTTNEYLDALYTPHDTINCPVLPEMMCGRCGKLGHTVSYCKRQSSVRVKFT